MITPEQVSIEIARSCLTVCFVVLLIVLIAIALIAAVMFPGWTPLEVMQ